ncbi:MAG: hypothetical protein HY532_08460 [Chloroflexi bacterium]|nr:hypothetical protein [Chloroflexota bacterium]
MTSDASLREDFPRYLQNVRVYLDNASKALDAAEPQKAGEFLWGGMAAAVKALAAYRGIRLRSHRDIWDYARAAAKELDDEEIFVAFRDANSLHGNFYEAGLTREEILVVDDGIRRIIRMLLDLLPSELLQQLA